MKTFLGAVYSVLLVGVGASLSECHGALSLPGASYSENFDNLLYGLPTGWGVYTNATASSLGTAVNFSPTRIGWTDTAPPGFRHVASADGLYEGAFINTDQLNSLDRALGIRQTGGFGDPGAAFVLQINNTAGLGSFNLTLEAQMLSVQGRSTTWTFDYRIGDSGTFTSLGTYSDPGVWGSTTISFNSSQLSAWNDQSSDIWFRVVALTPSTGSNNRDTFAIDDFSLTYALVPEPNCALLCGAGLLALCGARELRRKPMAEKLNAES